MSIKIISFDFDGTLVHSNISTENYYYTLFKNDISYSELQNKFKSFENDYLNEVPQLKTDFRNLGRFNEKDREDLYYRWNAARLKYIFPNLDDKLSNAFLEKIMTFVNTKSDLELYPDAYEILQLLKKSDYTLGILSGNNSSYIKKYLLKFSLNHIFDTILTPDVCNMEKKDIFPLYLKYVPHYSQILHIGDDPEIDYQIPKMFGMHSLWMHRNDSRYLPNKIEENDIIYSLNEIPEKITVLNKK